MLKIAIAFTFFFLARSTQAAEPPISVAELAEITGYPAERINFVDSTIESNEKAAKKNKPLGISRHYYSSKDGTFADISVEIGKKGTLLTPELEAKFSKTLLIPNYPGNLKALSLGGEIKGYSGIGMAGAGGSMHRSVVSLVNLDRDIQVTVSIGEEGLTPLDGAEAYREAVLRFDGVSAMIEKCLTVASNNVIATLSAGGTAAPTETPQSIQQLPPQQTASSKPPVFAPHLEPSEADSNAWIWWISGLVIVVLVFIAKALRKHHR